MFYWNLVEIGGLFFKVCTLKVVIIFLLKAGHHNSSQVGVSSVGKKRRNMKIGNKRNNKKTNKSKKAK